MNRSLSASLVLVMLCCCLKPQDGQEVSSSESALIAPAECMVFEKDGEDDICHSTGSTTKPFVDVRTSNQVCIDIHSKHPSDFIGHTGTGDCTNVSCLPAAAPCCPPCANEDNCEKDEGQGAVDDNGHRAVFNFKVRRPSPTESECGDLEFGDQAVSDEVRSTGITSLVTIGNTAIIAGTCMNKGVPCTFAVNVTDSGPSALATSSPSPSQAGLSEAGRYRAARSWCPPTTSQPPASSAAPAFATPRRRPAPVASAAARARQTAIAAAARPATPPLSRARRHAAAPGRLARVMRTAAQPQSSSCALPVL